MGTDIVPPSRSSRMPLLASPHRLVLAVLLATLFLGSGTVHAQPRPSDSAAAPSNREAERRARATAVALNYCRTSFHRIRRHPNKQVLVEERERILDNLNLNGIGVVCRVLGSTGLYLEFRP